MVRMLSLTENLHTILRVLYDDMMALCYPMSQVAMAIAGIGALLYIAFRVWQSLAQAEPIDLFPLMRPFAIGICILFFPTLVLGTLNGILSPLVKATHSLMAGQTLDMEQWQERRERLELEGREQMPPDSYYAEDEEMERELSELGVDDQTQQTLDRMNEERSSWSVKGLIFKGLAWILELLFAAAIVKTELPLPASLTWGVSFRPVPKWEFAVDLQYVLWSAYDQLDVQILNPSTNLPVLTIPASDKNYSNTLAFRFGGEYHALDWLTARMGMYVDESPVSSDYLNPETPSMTKLAYTAGVTFRPCKWMHVDLAYGYVNSADPERTGSYPYVNSVLALANEQIKNVAPEYPTTSAITDFSGNYTARAHTFSIGVGFSF